MSSLAIPGHDLATLILVQRRKLVRLALDELPPRLLALVTHLAVCLRLAVHLNRNRGWRPPPPITLTVGEAAADASTPVHLAFPAGFLAANPLTVAEFEDETARLAAAGYALSIADEPGAVDVSESR